MRAFSLILAFAFILTTTGWIVGQSNEGARRPLDLPSGGAGDGDGSQVSEGGGHGQSGASFRRLFNRVVVGTDGRLRVIDPETVQVAWETDAIAGWAYCLAVLPGGRHVAVGGQAGKLVLVAIPERFSADSLKKKEP